MQMDFYRLAAVLWAVWLLTWKVAAFWRHRPAARAPGELYRRQFALVIIGFLAMHFPLARGEPQLWPVGPALGWSMIAMTVAGFGLTWWARIRMGRMWSGGIDRTEQHEVIDGGPFALVRHPIYTGLIAAAVALAVVRGVPSAILGAALFSFGFVLKAKVEERFLEQELGGYEAYRARVPMIVPFVRP